MIFVLNKTIKSVIFLIALLLAPQFAFADSDGMLCIGERFIAYELRHFDSDGQHTLYILRPTTNDNVVSVETFNIPETVGQVHGLSCKTDKSVLISGFNEGVRFDLSAQAFQGGESPKRNAHQDHLMQSSMNSNDPVRILTDWNSETHQYQFHQLGYAFPPTGHHDGIIEHHSISRIVRINKTGRWVDGSHTILGSMRIETID